MTKQSINFTACGFFFSISVQGISEPVQQDDRDVLH